MSPTKAVPTIDALIELPEPGDVQISADGKRVAFQETQPDWKKNAFLSQLWLVGTATAVPRQLTFTAHSSTHPRWAPDGHWLAFLSQRAGDDASQIYRISATGGEAERLTELKTAVADLTWSPDGRFIAFTAPDPETDAERKRQKKYGKVHIEDQDFKWQHLWLLDVASRKCRKLTGGKEFHVIDYSIRCSLSFMAARAGLPFKNYCRARCVASIHIRSG